MSHTWYFYNIVQNGKECLGWGKDIYIFSHMAGKQLAQAFCSTSTWHRESEKFIWVRKIIKRVFESSLKSSLESILIEKLYIYTHTRFGIYHTLTSVTEKKLALVFLKFR